MNEPLQPGDVVLYWRDTLEKPDGTVELVGAEVFRIIGRDHMFQHLYRVKTLFGSKQMTYGFHEYSNWRLMGHIESDANV